MPVQAMPVTEHQPTDDVPRAFVEIPREWLMSGLESADVKRVQRSDTAVELGPDRLTLRGIELVIQRCWFREGHWLEVRRAITAGYIHSKSWVELVLRGDRRRRRSVTTL